MLTLVADYNIAHLDDYFCQDKLGMPVKLIALAGRDITTEVLAQYQPDALLIRSVTQITPELLADNHSVKFVGSATIGTDHIDLAYLAHRHIIFAHAAGCSKYSVAQYVMTAILTLHPQYWHAAQLQQPIKLGVIGLGNIGSTLVQYATDLGWQVLGYDPLLPASATNNASLDEVLRHSNLISIHVPLTTAQQSTHPTYHLIDTNALSKIPPTTVLINSARGQVISEHDLLADMTSTQRQVVLDVFEHEPVVSAELIHHMAIATPHIAGYTLEGKLRGTQMIYEQLLATLPKWAETDSAASVDSSELQTSSVMAALLPSNPYRWNALQAHPERLRAYYDIVADDARLRASIDANLGQVHGDTFDTLRKTYALRREWLT